jgi:hypothetical protein
LSGAKRIGLAAVAAIAAALGSVLGVVSVFVLGPLGWGVACVLLVGTTGAGTMLGQRLIWSGPPLPAWRVVVPTLTSFVIALIFERFFADCVVGDAVLWQCALVPWLGGFVGAVLGVLSGSSVRGSQ